MSYAPPFVLSLSKHGSHGHAAERELPFDKLRANGRVRR